jgi:ubiquinone/menaquinone biosynthesis C-methylase UbiE
VASEAEAADASEATPGRPTPDGFDQVFANVAASPRLNQLFDEVMGPLPPHVEPFSLVTRAGLDRVFDELQLDSGDLLVDLCCGRGGIGLWFAERSGAQLVGVDFSPAAIEQAEARARLFSGVQASFVVGDAAQTPLESETADAVVCIDALQMLPEREQALREVGRLLRPGGRAVITTWETDEEIVLGRTPIRDVGPLVEAAGLTLLLREEHPEWLERQRELFERAVAEDGDDAEPGVKMFAEEGRYVLPRMDQVRRVLVVATPPTGG